jgi:hypothetical protein
MAWQKEFGASAGDNLLRKKYCIKLKLNKKFNQG